MIEITHEPISIWIAFGMTLFAGLSTGIGSLIAFFSKKSNPSFLSGSLGFSAGVMLYISFMEFLPQSIAILSKEMMFKTSEWITVSAFFLGIALIWIVDMIIPSYENPHEPKTIEQMQESNDTRALKRVGIFTAIAIMVHNLPEGLAVFSSALQKPSLGISITIAIALHNIPEGIAVSVPIWAATGNKKKAFFWSFLSGLSEFFGALLGYFLLRPFFSGFLEGVLLAFVAWIMVFISLDELLPTAEKYGKHHLAILGVIFGLLVMALSLLLLS